MAAQNVAMAWEEKAAKEAWERRPLRERMRVQNSARCPVCVGRLVSMSVDHGFTWRNGFGGPDRLVIRGRCAGCSSLLEQILPME